MQKNECEMVTKGLCLGCTGLAEMDFVGKCKCKTYNEIKKRVVNDYKNTASLSK